MNPEIDDPLTGERDMQLEDDSPDDAPPEGKGCFAIHFDGAQE